VRTEARDVIFNLVLDALGQFLLDVDRGVGQEVLGKLEALRVE
jgi:hypothetical protein